MLVSLSISRNVLWIAFMWYLFLFRSINNYINEVLKRYQAIDNQKRKEKNITNNANHKIKITLYTSICMG